MGKKAVRYRCRYAVFVGLLVAASMLVTYAPTVGRAAPARVAPRVGFLLAEATSPRWVHDYRFLKAELHRISPTTKLDVQLANGDPIRQLGQADLELSRGAKVLIVVPVNTNAAAGIVSKAHRSGAKVIAYDQLINSSRLDLYDSFDRVAIGRAQGSWLAGHVARGGSIVIINGPKTSSSARLYRQGYYDRVLAERFRSRYFRNGGDYWTGGWDMHRAMREMTEALVKHHYNVQGVLAASDDLASGSIVALELAGRQGRTKVTGQDATPDALGRILDGEQSMTIYKPVSEEADAAAMAANAFLQGKPLPAQFHTTVRMAHGTIRAALFQPVVITRRNVKTALGDGVATKKAVCRGIPRKLCAGL